MFKQARQNSFIYILTKGANPTLETGVVQTVSQPRAAQQQFNPQTPYQYPQPMVVDIVANVGAERRNLNGLPSDLDIADYNGNVVVTLDKDKIINEVKVLFNRENDTINDYDNAVKRRDIYSGMLTALNPEEAEKKRQAEKLAALEASLAERDARYNQVLEQNQRLMEQMQAIVNKMEQSANTKSPKNKD